LSSCDRVTLILLHRFRWVFCQLEVLRHCFPPSVRQILEELPESLDDTYERILKGIHKANRRYAYRLLHCLAVASRPLLVEELADILAVDFNANEGWIPNFNLAWCWENQEEAVLSACSSLVSVISNGGSRVVQFSHFSVKEFLTSDRLANSMGDISWFHITLEPAHTILAQACLAALFFLDGHTNADHLKKVRLIEYAAHFWVKHTQFEKVEFRIKDAMDQFFDMDKPHFSAWVQIYDIEESLSLLDFEWDRTLVTPLYYAALCGFHGLVERHIVKHPQLVRARGGRSGTPLHSAVSYGRTEVAQILVAHGADIDSRGLDGVTALHFASYHGHLDTMKWLLDHGADVNAQSSKGHTPLHHAAFHRHPDASRILLEHNAQVNVRTERGLSPLYFALKTGHLDVARLLLDHCADVDARDNSGNSPLYSAVAIGNFDLIQILIEQKAEVNSRNNEGSTPFLAASNGGLLNVVRFLLDHAADAHVCDDSGKTPLHLAAAGGHLDVSQLLLNLKAEINARDGEGRTPLHYASRDGTSDVVRLLLEHGAHAHARDNAGNTLLHFAAINGSLEVIRMLLGCKVEVNAQNDEGITPLHEASTKGRLHVLQSLLEHGADASACDQNGKTASDVAWFGRRQQIRELLSEPVAD
jgi:ankyrin repeat protein